MYLCVNDKSYNVTDNYNKPYIKVNGSILPLTTNGGGLIHCKDNNGNTYRPMTYGPMSTSYLTTSSDSIGLTSVTALTEVSTTGTSYETEESTRDMYISSRSSYRFTSNEYYKATTTSTIILQGKVTNFNLYGTSTSSFQTGNNYQQITTTYSIYRLSGINSSPISSSYSSTRNNTSRSDYGTLTYAIISKPFINNATSTSYWYGIGSHLRSSYISSSENNGVLYVTSKYTGNEKYYIDQDMIATSMSYHEIFISFTSDTKIVSTTNTVYLTSEITTGYSGIYSSIQSGSSSWYTSAINSEGLLSTTALTRESTSGTSYLTATETQNMGFTFDQYRISRESPYTTVIRTCIANDLATGMTSSTITTSLYLSSTFSVTAVVYVLANSSRQSSFSISTYSTRKHTDGYEATTSGYKNAQTATRVTIYQNTTSTLADGRGITCNSEIQNNSINCASTLYSGVNTSSMSITLLTDSIKTNTTGTSYLTCESTSGYSGVSSSSSIAYGWQ